MCVQRTVPDGYCTQSSSCGLSSGSLFVGTVPYSRGDDAMMLALERSAFIAPNPFWLAARRTLSLAHDLSPRRRCGAVVRLPSGQVAGHACAPDGLSSDVRPRPACLRRRTGSTGAVSVEETVYRCCGRRLCDGRRDFASLPWRPNAPGETFGRTTFAHRCGADACPRRSRRPGKGFARATAPRGCALRTAARLARGHRPHLAPRRSSRAARAAPSATRPSSRLP